MLTQICKFLYNNRPIKYFSGKIPYIIYFMLLFRDFTCLEIYYSYYGFFVFYIYLLYYSTLNFWAKTNAVKDNYLYEYFYGNEIPYIEQRENIRNAISLPSTKQNNKLFTAIKNGTINEYILNDLTVKYSYSTPEYEKRIKRYNDMMKRYALIVIHFILIIYVLYNKHRYTMEINVLGLEWKVSFAYVLILFLIWIIYISINVLKSFKENYSNDLASYTYSKGYNILYWLNNIIMLGLYYILFVKTTLFIIPDGILVQFGEVKLVYHYFFEEKLVFFYYYVDYYLNYNFSKPTVEFLISFIGQLNVKDIIDESTTIRDLKILINDISLSYMQHIETLITVLENKNISDEDQLESKMLVRAYMNCISNITNLLCFCKVFTFYLNAWHIVRNPRSIKTIIYMRKIIKWLWMFYRK